MILGKWTGGLEGEASDSGAERASGSFLREITAVGKLPIQARLYISGGISWACLVCHFRRPGWLVELVGTL